MDPNSAPLPLVMGTTSVHSKGSFKTSDAVKQLLAALQEHGINTIDSAQLYGGGESETLLGEAGAAELGFTLDTKVPGIFIPGSLEPARIESDFRRSLERMKTKKLDVFYIHSPDPTYPVAQTLEVLDRLHREGLFARLGLSNFSVEEVREVCDVAANKGLVAPTVFQGNYSAVARRAEDELIPLLREKGIAFYAYSPLAGGFLAKRNREELFGTGTGGRFAKVGGFAMYQNLYSNRPKLVDALDTWSAIAQREGCESPAELGYRWVAWNSALKTDLGDKMTIGASKLETVAQVVGWMKKGPLSEESVKAIDAMWEKVKDEAPMDNLHQ